MKWRIVVAWVCELFAVGSGHMNSPSERLVIADRASTRRPNIFVSAGRQDATIPLVYGGNCMRAATDLRAIPFKKTAEPTVGYLE